MEVWRIGEGHNGKAEWLKDLKNELGNDKHPQERVVITIDNVTKQCRKMPNWKASGKDGIQGYWIKDLSNLHERIAIEKNKILMVNDSLPTWMTHGDVVFFQKDPRKGTAVENY